MESWRIVWRVGYAPEMPAAGLAALRDALRRDDERLLQGCTTKPPPLLCVHDWPVEAADAIGFVGWHAGAQTVGEVEEFFARASYQCDENLKETAGCRWFLNWYDDTPREEMRRELLAEVVRELERRYRAAEAQTGVVLALDCKRPEF